jgi:cytoskeletal protein CcmA (bactofilin family)
MRTRTRHIPQAPSQNASDRIPGDRLAIARSLIGSDIIITGNIEAKVDLQIEGTVTGDVHCSTLVLGEGSSVNGRIYAARLKVYGSIEGAVETQDLAIEGNARVAGDITYERLRVANGGIVEGSLTRRVSLRNSEAEEPSAANPQPPVDTDEGAPG